MPGNEMERSISYEVAEDDRYNRSPGLFTAAGKADRRREARHSATIRALERELRERMARAAVEAGVAIAEIEARAEVAAVAESVVVRMIDASRRKAADDPEKAAMLAILSDDTFHVIREILNRPGSSDGLYS